MKKPLTMMICLLSVLVQAAQLDLKIHLTDTASTAAFINPSYYNTDYYAVVVSYVQDGEEQKKEIARIGAKDKVSFDLTAALPAFKTAEVFSVGIGNYVTDVTPEKKTLYFLQGYKALCYVIADSGTVQLSGNLSRLEVKQPSALQQDLNAYVAWNDSLDAYARNFYDVYANIAFTAEDTALANPVFRKVSSAGHDQLLWNRKFIAENSGNAVGAFALYRLYKSASETYRVQLSGRETETAIIDRKSCDALYEKLQPAVTTTVYGEKCGRFYRREEN